MEFTECFPVWDRLTQTQQQEILRSAATREFKKGTVLYDGTTGCTGFIVVQSGQLRAYITSEDGREISVYRLFERDICLMSASCILNSIQFDISIQAERDTSVWIIPPELFQRIMQESAPLANYVGEIMQQRLSDVMWLIEQILWKRLDQRIAAFLVEESALEDSLKLTTTHEQIARHLGTAREVVTRMLRTFQSEGMVRLSRGSIEITDEKKLAALADN
jgi:CRP/FNR family transcriptional regulator